MSWRMGVRVLERVAMRPVIEDPQSVADVLAGPPRDRLLSSRVHAEQLDGEVREEIPRSPLHHEQRAHDGAVFWREERVKPHAPEHFARERLRQLVGVTVAVHVSQHALPPRAHALEPR
eukprot:6212369-Pleurochrysis_carterae.AAC.3